MLNQLRDGIDKDLTSNNTEQSAKELLKMNDRGIDKSCEDVAHIIFSIRIIPVCTIFDLLSK